uniref:GB1/RHD3-type G domain-containing protein n=1 Tax=Ananas comosus var. bracteatus TaxID=296719 RepID=A0A6V7QY43_ANACO
MEHNPSNAQKSSGTAAITPNITNPNMDAQALLAGLQGLAGTAAGAGAGAGQVDVSSLLSNLMQQLAVSAHAQQQQQQQQEQEQEQDPMCVAGPMQMIGGDGTFFQHDVDDFILSAKEIAPASADYAVVSIIGAQSSGKSYLLNRLFGTNFQVMDAAKGRGQTTKGMWLSRCAKPSMLVMDVEGFDGRERGEDDTSFEKQAALFSLTISDLMMVNMWLRDIGRQHGGSIPLFKTIFRERAKLEPGKTRVLVIVRGYDYETPMENLQNDLVTQMEELWESVNKQPGQENKLFSDYIEVMVFALPDKLLVQDFKEQVTNLRNWFSKGGLAGLRQDKVAASGFAFSAKGIWETIRQNKELDLPAHRILVSTCFCEKIVRENLDALALHEDYMSMKSGAQYSPKEFSTKLEGLLECVLTRYDAETDMYDANVRAAKRHELENGTLHLLEPFCKDMFNRLRTTTACESKDKIAAQLRNADDPATAVDASVQACLKEFTESCKELSSRYQVLCDENCKELRNELTSFAQIKAESIKEQRMREELERQRIEADREAERAREEAERLREEAKRAKEEQSAKLSASTKCESWHSAKLKKTQEEGRSHKDRELIPCSMGF